MAALRETLEQARDAIAREGAASFPAPNGSATLQLDARDLPAIDRALQAIRENETAWLGFKLVDDARSCLQPPAAGRFATGSANADSFLFFANDSREIACGHAYNERDRFQILDVTRGPAMHTGEFPGLSWTALPLRGRVRVVVFGAGEVSRHLAEFAHAVDFDVAVLDCNPAFLNAGRFPHAQLVPVDFNALDPALVRPGDFACILTRSHTYDVEALACALAAQPAYAGMIGHPDKIAANYETLRAQGATEEAIAAVHAPIGIKCGARTPSEIAVSIVAELIQVRKTLGSADQLK